MADVIVVGGGIVGAACAHALVQAGLQVLVIDAGHAGATAAGMGHLVLIDDNPAEMALCRASLETWDAWAPRMDAGCAFTRRGTLWVAADDEEMTEARRKLQRLQGQGVACELLDAGALAAAEPALRPGLAGALRVPGDSVVYAPHAARWLLRQAPGRIAFEQATVSALERGGVRLADGQRRAGGAVLLAAGLQAAQLCPGLPLRAKKGHLAITDRYPGTVRHQLVELGYVKSAHQATGASVAFNVQPRPTGQLMLGSSRQFDTTDTTVEPGMLARMLQRCLDYLPGLRDFNIIRTWTGIRVATPDGLPLIGRHPRHEGLWLALGHEGLGVTTAPATARLLAAQITGGALPLDAEPYAAHRFAELA